MDEAERCHRLAILDHGVKVADGTPSELKANTGMHVVEVIADDPYHAQVVIAKIPEVASVTQLGVRLRVLIPDTHNDPTGTVDSALRGAGLDAQARLSSATLEDVFVAVTLEPQRQAA
jgi:ABC-2 type transport system ATP-binding protein